MKFSIIGTGFIFPAHVQAIRDVKGTVLDVVNDSRGPDAWKEMVRTTEADCIVILSPNYLHKEMILESVKNGKIVLCEKPLVISSKDCEELNGKGKIFGVLQLRHHPLVKEIQSKIKEKGNVINMDISVFRDRNYNECWKGQKEKSGGVLFNLGIHYFDLLLHLFGDAEEIKTEYLDEKTGQGVIKGKNYICNWKVSTNAEKENQKRVFEINGTDYNFSSKENLSFENLHKFVYEDLLQGKGIGPNDVLKAVRLIENLYKANNYWNHQSAEIEDGASIGQGTKIWHNCQIKNGAFVGENCTIGHNCLISSKSKIGNGCKLQSNIDVWEGVTLEKDVFVGPSVVFTNDLNPRAKYSKSQYPEYGKWMPTLVKEGATIGANATLICGATIGKQAMIGAGAVIKKDVPDYAIVVGNPARHIGWICECGNKIEFENEKSKCGICERNYEKNGEIICQIT